MQTADIAFLVDQQNGFVKDDLPVPGGAEIDKKTVELIEHIERSNQRWWVVASQDWHPKGHISFASSHAHLAPYTDIYLQASGEQNRAIAIVDGSAMRSVDVDRRGHIIRIRQNELITTLPPDAVKQTLWPDHCGQGTASAQYLEPILNALPLELTAQLCDPTLNGRHLLTATGRNGQSYAVIRKGCDPRYDSYSLVKDNGGITETPARAYFEEMGKAMQEKGIKNVKAYFGGLATDYCVDWSYVDTRAILPGILKKYGVEGVKFYFLPEISRGISPEGTQAVLARMTEEGMQQITVDDIISAPTSKRSIIGRPQIAPGG